MSASTHPHPSHPRSSPASSDPALLIARPQVASRTASVPWYIWCGAIAVTSATIGGAWDVSWHRSIGRDSFWTPAHMAIYACGVLAAIICSYLIVKATVLRDPELSAALVNVFGRRSAVGIFLAGWCWGAGPTSAPFCNSSHNAYCPHFEVS